MKLVKLVYISHGWYLGLTGEPLISEAVQAWKYGPVINTLYHTFKKYKNDQILSLENDPQTYQSRPPGVENEEIRTFLDRIWEVYSNYSGLQLSTLTHEPGSPWDTTWNQLGGKDSNAVIIPNNLIKEYYKSKKNANRQATAATL